jgi:hypothetical protein
VHVSAIVDVCVRIVVVVRILVAVRAARSAALTRRNPSGPP